MNFAYLDARSLLETVLVPPPEPVQAIPCDLGPTWAEFGEELHKFKMEFAKIRAQVTVNLASLNEKQEEMNVLRMMMSGSCSAMPWGNYSRTYSSTVVAQVM